MPGHQVTAAVNISRVLAVLAGILVLPEQPLGHAWSRASCSTTEQQHQASQPGDDTLFNTVLK
jgi:hypothetical protein